TDNNFDRPRYPQMMPLLMVYRSLDSDIGVFDAGKLKLTQDKGLVDNRTCIILRHDEDIVWVDPERDFIPMRYRVMERGITSRSLDIKYTADPQSGWVPTSWYDVRLGTKGEIEESVNMNITEYKIGDPIPDDRFD